MTLIYLACPYSHEDTDVRERRFRAANRAAGQLMKNGLAVFSPISHSHPIELECGTIATSSEFVEKFDLPILRHCDELYVLSIEGWRESRGVTEEIAMAKALGIPVLYMDEDAAYASTGSAE